MFYVLFQISHINMPSLLIGHWIGRLCFFFFCFMGAHAAFDCLFWANLLDAQQASRQASLYSALSCDPLCSMHYSAGKPPPERLAE